MIDVIIGALIGEVFLGAGVLITITVADIVATRRLDRALAESRALREAEGRRYITESGVYR